MAQLFFIYPYQLIVIGFLMACLLSVGHTAA